ncbi:MULTISPECIES: hypothetical protein [unclassified Streptomyces]|uniref:hypothetical protein n=1 Tax=unclassified Streptomyces TaxID=2593676 RepID=UPI00339095BD
MNRSAITDPWPDSVDRGAASDGPGVPSVLRDPESGVEVAAGGAYAALWRSWHGERPPAA